MARVYIYIYISPIVNCIWCYNYLSKTTLRNAQPWSEINAFIDNPNFLFIRSQLTQKINIAISHAGFFIFSYHRLKMMANLKLTLSLILFGQRHNWQTGTKHTLHVQINTAPDTCHGFLFIFTRNWQDPWSYHCPFHNFTFAQSSLQTSKEKRKKTRLWHCF